MSEPPRWPYDQPHTGYTRYGVRMKSGLLLKGVDLDDAQDMVAGEEGATILRQTVVYVTDGPDEGYEVLSPWKPVWKPVAAPVAEEKEDEQVG